MTTIKKHPILLILLGILTVILLSSFVFLLGIFKTPLVSNQQGVTYSVVPGASMASVTNDLARLDIIKHPWLFNVWVHIKGNQRQLKAGEYLFPNGVTAAELLTQITTGRGIIYHAFIIVPGWNFARIRQAISQEPNLHALTVTMSDAEMMRHIDANAVAPEGMFYPDTYYFVKGSTDVALLKRAYHLMQTKLGAAWDQRAQGLPYRSAYDALIAASIVEKEAKIASDRPLIASVIINRLAKNMPLQMDPTVIYGVGTRYDGTIHHQDLLDQNPYNTYRNRGLPPTPIAMPSLESINATLHPAQTDYLYFVAREDGKGGHQFSQTLLAHHEAVGEAKNRILSNDFVNDELMQRYLLKRMQDNSTQQTASNTLHLKRS